MYEPCWMHIFLWSSSEITSSISVTCIFLSSWSCGFFGDQIHVKHPCSSHFKWPQGTRGCVNLHTVSSPVGPVSDYMLQFLQFLMCLCGGLELSLSSSWSPPSPQPYRICTARSSDMGSTPLSMQGAHLHKKRNSDVGAVIVVGEDSRYRSHKGAKWGGQVGEIDRGSENHQMNAEHQVSSWTVTRAAIYALSTFEVQMSL